MFALRWYSVGILLYQHCTKVSELQGARSAPFAAAAVRGAIWTASERLWHARKRMFQVALMYALLAIGHYIMPPFANETRRGQH